MHLYDFKAITITRKEISFDIFKDKVVLIVNTASKCGLTPQYEDLELLHQKHKDNGLVIIGFPCNQFGKQEPGTEKEIKENCLINYGVTFQMMSKIKVNGNNTHPLYKFLKKEMKGFLSNRVKWNFTKFLLDRKGNPVKRYSSTTKPFKIESKIVELLNL